MRKFLVPALLALSVFSLSGCVFMHVDTDIAADGSGTMKATIAMSETVQQCILELKELDAGKSDDMDFPAFDEIDGSRMSEAGKDWGVKVTRFEKKMEGERETLEFELAFENLEGLSYVMNRTLGDGQDSEGMAIFDAGDGNLVLRNTTYDFPPVPADEKEEKAPAHSHGPDMGGMGGMM